MQVSYDHIRQLFLERLTGTITAEDGLYLEKLLVESSEARKIWEEFEMEAKILNADKILADIDPEQTLETWKKAQNQRIPTASKIGWYRWIAAATLVLGIAFALFFLPRGTEPKAGLPKYSNYKKGQPLPPNSVALTIHGGKTIILDRNKPAEFKVGNVLIRNTGKELIFSGKPENEETLNSLFVPVRETFSAILSDGSRVLLNSDSELQFPFQFSKENREVHLVGEGYFEVKQNHSHPFIVHTKLHDISVTGTSFNVNTFTEGVVRTSLVEGSVNVSAGKSGSIRLVPGMEATYQAGGGFSSMPFDAGEVLSWRDGVQYFNQTPLEELSGVIYRWFGIRTAFKTEGIESYRVSGLIEKEHLTEFLQDLQATSNVRYELSDSLLVLSRKPDQRK